MGWSSATEGACRWYMQLGRHVLCGYSYPEPKSEQSQSTALEVRTQGTFVGSTRVWLRRKLLRHGPPSPHFAIVNHSYRDIPEQNCASLWLVKLAVWTLYLQKALPPSVSTGGRPLPFAVTACQAPLLTEWLSPHFSISFLLEAAGICSLPLLLFS